MVEKKVWRRCNVEGGQKKEEEKRARGDASRSLKVVEVMSYPRDVES